MLGLTIVYAAALWLAALMAAAMAWPARRLDPWVRAMVLGSIAAFDFALPLLAPERPVVLRVITVLVCPVAGGKLMNLGVEAEWWRERRLKDWLWYLVESFVLVPRLHAAGRGRAGAAGRAIRGVVEVSAGGLVLWWAFSADLGRWSFWLDHSAKLLGAFLCAFDGLFVFREGVGRLCGMRLLPLSRDPILAATPAEFWRRYNCEAGRFLREDLFVPLRKRVGAGVAMGAVFLINGVFHEYLAWLMVGRVQGYQTAFFVVNGMAVLATWRLRPRGAGKAVGRALTVAFLVVTSVLFFGTVQQFMPLYSRGGILP